MEHGTKKFQLHDDLIGDIDGVLLKISKINGLEKDSIILG